MFLCSLANALDGHAASRRAAFSLASSVVTQSYARASNVALKDYGNFFNAIAKHPKNAKPAHVSFDVRWHGADDRQQLRDEKFGFGGTFISGSASITFSAKTEGSAVVYRSEPGGTKVLYAGSGVERNGVFFV